MARMVKNESKTPTIQVLERAFGLLDVLAAHPDPVPLKVISERAFLGNALFSSLRRVSTPKVAV